MTTETIIDTTPRPLRAPPARLTKKQARCGNCACLKSIDERVGWCFAHTQYRSTRIDRECGEFRTRTTED